VVSPTGSSVPTLLVVDDEEGVRNLAARMLRDAGYEVLTAADGAEALSLVQSAQAVDVVVSDLRMPEMDGEILAGRVAQHDPACRFVFISGFPGTRTLPGPLVAKPFRVDDLLSAIEAALREKATLPIALP
jgi:two-component system, cell cycle sensor histidine kinase and response regulator CckA